MKKKILFIIWTFTDGGGSERILSNIVNNINYDDYEVDILEYRNMGKQYPKVNKNVEILKAVTYNKSNLFIKLRNRFRTILVFYMPSLLRRFVIKKKYDIEIGFNYLIPQRLVTKSKNVLKIGWMHGSIENLSFPENKKYYKLQKNIFENLNIVVPISNNTQNSIINLYPQYSYKLRKIYNGYDFDKISNSALGENFKINKKNDEKIIIALGRLDENKNFILLIEALKILKIRNINFKTIILGEGEEKNRILNKINKYQLQDYIKLLGYKNNPYKYINCSDILAVTSKAEGFPTVIAEAMTIGIPFISTDVSGVEELINNGECGIVAKDDPLDYANKLEWLIKNENLCNMGEKCKKYINKFSIENQVKEINLLFKEGEKYEKENY